MLRAQPLPLLGSQAPVQVCRGGPARAVPGNLKPAWPSDSWRFGTQETDTRAARQQVMAQSRPGTRPQGLTTSVSTVYLIAKFNYV